MSTATSSTDNLRESGHSRDLYPPIEPFNSGWLPVSDLHQIYYEECGNKDGKPFLFLHGGPGSGSSPNYRRYIDPTAYRIVLFDQRGCGKSKPNGELKENTTWDLVSDIEKLRNHLQISKWVVFGGSWGSTLALAYAEKHPESVKALIIFGVFTLSRKEMSWVYKEGACNVYPDKWEKFIAPIPPAERRDILSAYHRRFTGSDQEELMKCVKAWTEWEMCMFGLIPDPALVKACLADENKIRTKALIECHYFIHGGWFPSDGYLIENLDKIQHIPTTIISCRYDIITPMVTAWEIHKRLPEAEFHIVPNGAHSYSDCRTEIMTAADKYNSL